MTGTYVFVMRSSSGLKTWAGVAQIFCSGDRQKTVAAAKVLARQYDESGFAVEMGTVSGRNARQCARKARLTTEEIINL